MQQCSVMLSATTIINHHLTIISLTFGCVLSSFASNIFSSLPVVLFAVFQRPFYILLSVIHTCSTPKPCTIINNDCCEVAIIVTNTLPYFHLPCLVLECLLVDLQLLSNLWSWLPLQNLLQLHVQLFLLLNKQLFFDHLK